MNGLLCQWKRLSRPTYWNIIRFLRDIFIIIIIIIVDDGEDNRNAYYHTPDDEMKNSVQTEEEKVYNISDRLYEKINCVLTVFL